MPPQNLPTSTIVNENSPISTSPLLPANTLTDDLTALLNRASLITAHDEHLYDGSNAVVPPIVQTSLFTFSSYDHAERVYNEGEKHWFYSRYGNPTVRQFEEMVAELEEAEDALGFASGMSAISAVALTFLEPGDKLVCVKNVYKDAYRLFETILRQHKIDVVYVDGKDLKAVDDALRGAKLFYMESPTSWVMESLDVGALARLAHKHGALSAIDNSWATPILQQPLKLGVDVVIHTASKYLGGHSDVIAGVVASSKEFIDKLRNSRVCIGGKMSPFEAWLLIRGLRTLPLRIKAVGASALVIAKKLVEHPMIEKVHHPGLEKLPEGLMGTTGLFSFIFKDGVDIKTFINALKLFKIGVSWGGHESLIFPASLVLMHQIKPSSAIEFGIHPRLVRVYIGLAGTENLWEDLKNAITVAS